MADQSTAPDYSQLSADLDASKPQPGMTPQNSYGLPAGGINTVVNAATPAGEPGQKQDPGMIMNALQSNSAAQKAIVGQEMGEMAPQQAKYNQLTSQPMPQKPDLKGQLMQAPGVKDYLNLSQEVKKSSEEYMTTAGILSGLVGAFSRKHTTLALKAFTAAVDGFKKGQGEAVKQQLEIFQDANKQAVENAKMLQDEYNNAMNERNASAQEILSNMKIIAEKYHDTLMAQKVDDGDFFKMQSLLLQRDKAGNNLTAVNDKMTGQIEQLQGKQKDTILAAAKLQGGMMEAAANQAQQVLMGKQPMPVSSTRNPQNLAVINLVDKISEVTGKPYDQAQYPAYAAAIKKLAESKVPPDIGKTEQSIAKVNEHLGTLQNAMTELNSGELRIANQAAQKLAKAWGRPEIVNAQTAVGAVSQEFHRVYVPTGGVEDERAEAASNIDPSSSPEQIKGAIATMKELMAGQAKAIYMISQTIQQGGDVAALNVPAAYITKISQLGPKAVSEEAQGGESSGGPSIGTVQDGYKFKGGNPADQSSWEKAE